MVRTCEQIGDQGPSRTPDAYVEQLSVAEGIAWADAAVWWEDGANDTVIDVRRSAGIDPEHPGNAAVCSRWVRNALEFSRRGLGPTMSALGIEIAASPVPDYPHITNYRLRTPPTITLVERANAQQYSPTAGRRMRYDTHDGTLYAMSRFFPSLREGLMIIPTDGSDPWLRFHDVADHLLVGLSLSEELVEALAQEADRLMHRPETHPEFGGKTAEQLQSDFLGIFDKALFSTHFLEFLDEGEDALTLWTSLLATDIETVRGYAQRANERLRSLQPLTPEPSVVPRQHRRLGWLPLPR